MTTKVAPADYLEGFSIRGMYWADQLVGILITEFDPKIETQPSPQVIKNILEERGWIELGYDGFMEEEAYYVTSKGIKVVERFHRYRKVVTGK